MRRSRFTEEQIIMALRQAESGTLVADICRKAKIGRQALELTFFGLRARAASRLERKTMIDHTHRPGRDAPNRRAASGAALHREPHAARSPAE